MMLADAIATNWNWNLVFTAIAALATFGMYWDNRRKRATDVGPQPFVVAGAAATNAEMQRDLKAMNHRLVEVERWRNQLTAKMESDKQTILDAGSKRGREIFTHVDEVRKELSAKIDSMEGRVIATLKNTGAI